jgi:hypothetical protein
MDKIWSFSSDISLGASIVDRPNWACWRSSQLSIVFQWILAGTYRSPFLVNSIVPARSWTKHPLFQGAVWHEFLIPDAFSWSREPGDDRTPRRLPLKCEMYERIRLQSVGSHWAFAWAKSRCPSADKLLKKRGKPFKKWAIMFRWWIHEHALQVLKMLRLNALSSAMLAAIFPSPSMILMIMQGLPSKHRTACPVYHSEILSTGTW